MTENTTTTDPLARVVPAGCDPLDDLTAGELGHIGKLLSCDPYNAVKDPTTGLRWPAFAHLAWVWAKRTNPSAKLAPYLDLRPTELTQVLGLDDDDEPDPEDATEQPELAIEENPTDSPHAS